MTTNSKTLHREVKKLLIILICIVALSGVYPFWGGNWERAQAELESPILVSADSGLIILQRNSLAQLSNPADPPLEAVLIIDAILTGYSSTVLQTDDTPYTTAAGTQVRDGIVANNYFYFGTKIRIPELYGDKIFTVEDRMSWEKSNYHFDVWFSSYEEALNFGAKRTYIEVLE